MKTIRHAFVASAMMWTTQCLSESSGSPVFLGTLAKSDVIGIGTYGGWESGSDRLNNITYWLGDLGTNSVMLTPISSLDGQVFPQDVETNDTVVFLGIRLGWSLLPSNTVFRARPSSAWEWREKWVQAGSSGLIPLDPFRFPGTWIKVSTNTEATVNFISNVVQSLCVSPDLIRYSQSLIPPLDVGWDNELFLFKADAHMEMLKLEWGESEDFLVHILNSPQFPTRIRGSALFQLKKRFGWPATNTVPEP